MTGLLILILAVVLGIVVSPWFFLLAVPVVLATWAAESGSPYRRYW